MNVGLKSHSNRNRSSRKRKLPKRFNSLEAVEELEQSKISKSSKFYLIKNIWCFNFRKILKIILLNNKNNLRLLTFYL